MYVYIYIYITYVYTLYIQPKYTYMYNSSGDVLFCGYACGYSLVVHGCRTLVALLGMHPRVYVYLQPQINPVLTCLQYKHYCP